MNSVKGNSCDSYSLKNLLNSISPKYTYSDGTIPSICIIGAGFSGILAGIKLKTELGIHNFVIFDQHNEVGGVWLVNTYPGCGPDTPSHLYSYSSEVNPYWSHNYPTQSEILKYLQDVSHKHDLYSNIKFMTEVIEAQWDEDFDIWRIRVHDKKLNTSMEYTFNIVINSPGALRVPNIPKCFLSFKGPLIHSAKWDPSIDLSDKVVALVGSGASAVQILPHLSQNAKEIHCFQRKPAWVLPKTNFVFSPWIIWIFAHVPFVVKLFRWMIFWIMECFYLSLVRGTFIRAMARWSAMKHLRVQVNDEDTRKKLEPNYALGCKRIMISNKYYPCFNKPNVKLHVDPIIGIGDNSIITKGDKYHKIDIIILATGFHVQEYFAPLTVIGIDGLNLLNFWMTVRPTGYLGIVASSVPNQFGILGPHTGIGHNSIIFMAECQVNYIIKLIKEMIRTDSMVVSVKETVESKEMIKLDKRMKKMVWGGGGTCGSWYANEDGLNTTLWPWSCVNYWWRTRNPNLDKFTFKSNLKSVEIDLKNNNTKL